MQTHSLDYLYQVSDAVTDARRDEYKSARRNNRDVDEDQMKTMDDFAQAVMDEILRREKLGIENPEGWCDVGWYDHNTDEYVVCKCKKCQSALKIQWWWRERPHCSDCPKKAKLQGYCYDCYDAEYERQQLEQSTGS